MHSRLLLIGLTGLLIAGLFLGGCGPKEIPPTKEAETTILTQAPEKEAPPRPGTPFVTTEEATLFEDDFDDGNADGWALEPGWDVSLGSNNYVLTGHGHSFARPDVVGWSDYTIEAKIKLVKGSFHFNLRENSYAGHIRYFLGVHTGGLELNKQITEDFFNLSHADVPLQYNRWYTVQATVDSSTIKIYLNDTLVINYKDDNIPILSGIFSFETQDDSIAHFDDISVTGTQAVQRAQWVKTGGPSGGLGYDVRIHPLDKNIMFVTDNPSGVNKSYNGGDSWVQRNKGITARTGSSGDGIPIFCLTVDPNNPNIVWAGTQSMRGIYKSTDGGETWIKKDNGIEEWDEITFRNFGICPGNSDVVFTGAEISTGILGTEFDKAKGKIYKTKDGGGNWRCVWEGGSLARFVLFDPTNPDIMYASTGIFDREAYNNVGEGVLKSTDGGETWRQINNGLNNLFVGFLEMHPEEPRTLFAAAGNNVHRDNNGVYKTTDGGESWIQVLRSKGASTVVTISPSDPKIVYAGGEHAFYRSNDGGENWQMFWKEAEHCYGPPGVRAGFPISAVVDPDDPMTIFVNNYSGGVFKSVDGAETWIDCSTGYTGADLHDIVVIPYNPNIVYAIGRSGPFWSFNGGQEWAGLAFSPAAFAEWNAVAVNPQNPQEMLIADEFEGSLLRSINGGNTWILVFKHPLAGRGEPQESRHGFKAITYAPSDPNIIYAGMRKGRRTIDGDFPPRPSFGIYKSVNGGKTWQEKNHGLEKANKNINDIVVHPQNPDIAYAATWRDGIFKTTDGGESWVAINNGLLSLDVRSLAIDSENPDVVYAGLAEGVGIFKTVNGGELWEAINAGIQVECPSFLQRVGQVQPGVSLTKPKRVIGGEYYSIPWTNIASLVIDPVETQTLYAADLHLGVYMSTDGGATWIPINEGLSTKAVSALNLSADGWVLYAATKGEGVFRLELW
ncbi:Ycf48-like protein [subsurface metagenome]